MARRAGRSRRPRTALPWRPLLGALLALVGTSACGGGAETVLHVRSELPAELGEALESSFEAAHPDVDLRLSAGDADGDLEALRAGDADFDVWLGASAIDLETAAGEDLLRPVPAPWGTGGASPWHPVMASPFVIAFDRTVVALAEAPLDWVDVFHHGWFGEVGALDPVSSPEGRFLLGAMVVQALRDDDDLNRGFDWLARLHEQVGFYAPESAPLLRRVADGELLLAVVPRAAVEAARAGSPTLHYRVPVSGTPEALRGVAAVAGTDVAEAAGAFVDHLGSAEVATVIKRHTHWEPMTGTVDEDALPDDFELEQRWTAYAPAVDTLAVELGGWLARWEVEVRTR